MPGMMDTILNLGLNDETVKGLIEQSKDARFAYKMLGGKGIDGEHDGWIEHDSLAMLGQMHFAFDVKLVQNFIEHCKRYRRR